MRINQTSIEGGFNHFGRASDGKVIPLAERISRGAKPSIKKRRGQTFNHPEAVLCLGALAEFEAHVKTGFGIRDLFGGTIPPEKVQEVYQNLVRKFSNMIESFHMAAEKGVIAPPAAKTVAKKDAKKDAKKKTTKKKAAKKTAKKKTAKKTAKKKTAKKTAKKAAKKTAKKTAKKA